MLRTDLLARLQTGRFWTDYLHFTDPEGLGTSAPAWDVSLDLAIDYGTSAATLLVRDLGDSGVPIEVAWDDQAHWHPHVFRWPEVDAVCRRIATRLEAYPHPGIPLLLLYRFAPLTSDAEYQFYRPYLEDAWAKLALFTPDEIGGFIDRVDYRSQGVEWHYMDPVGWTVEQLNERAERALYSLRVPGNTDFQFGLWNRFSRRSEGCPGYARRPGSACRFRGHRSSRQREHSYTAA